MAGYQALASTMESVVGLLNRRFREEIRTGRRPSAVAAGTIDFDLVNTPGAQIVYPAVSVYCYRLSVDRETRPGWSSVGSRDGIPRIPLRMHLLVTAWDEAVENELRWLGLAAKVLESEPVLTGPRLTPDGGWRDGEGVQVVSDDMALETMTEAFQALTADYRLYLLYLARTIVIDGRPEADGTPVTTVATGLRDLP
jgi:hypothetical protein